MTSLSDRNTRIRRVWRVARKVLRQTRENDTLGESAKTAFYLFLSVFPFLITVFALTGTFGGEAAFGLIMREVNIILPQVAAEELGRYVQEITSRGRPGMLSLGLALSFWSASNIFLAITNGLNRVFGVVQYRVWWRRRLLALGVVLTTSMFLVIAVAAILAGPQIVFRLGLAHFWVYLRWPCTFVVVTSCMWLLYYLLPNLDERDYKLEALIGAAVGTLLWMVGTALLQLYIAKGAGYTRVYGFMGGVIVLLLWFYTTAFALFLGAEVAAVLYRSRSED